MTKYKTGTLYIGNIIRKTNGEIVVAKENVFLMYSSKEDCFYTLDALNYLLDLENNKHLTKEEIEEFTKIVNANKYQYKEENNNQIYIDPKTISIAFQKEKEKKSKK